MLTMKKWQRLLPVTGVVLLVGVLIAGESVEQKSEQPESVAVESMELDLLSRYLENPAAYIPSQCYTDTVDEAGVVHNPCFSCHTDSPRPNYVDDAELQTLYLFPEGREQNPWINLFKNRTGAVAAIGDREMQDYIDQSNYFATGSGQPTDKIALQYALENLSPAWDYNGNGRWDGYVPDAWFDFDEAGFDRNPLGEPTGWRAFAYYPFLGTFWPTNGSTDDVLIRLPEPFRQDLQGVPSRAVYQVNLAIVEAMLKERDVSIEPVDERDLGGVDIDKNGEIAIADRVVYRWAPRNRENMWYVGLANLKQQQGEYTIAAGLYPEGTEFLHSVRYIDVDEAGTNHLSARMKELRYARKYRWMSYTDHRARVEREIKEKDDFPDRLRTVMGNMEEGVSNGQGWVYAGFIEDARGQLRPQNYEELVFCVGCHGGIGGNRDGIFSFTRKFDERVPGEGWYHWSQRSLRGVPDRIREDGEFEYSYYLTHNGSGNEFRSNPEIIERFFNPQGQPDSKALTALQSDISALLYASPERAMRLNKAYRVIVKEQSFIHGRDATTVPLESVHREVEPGQETGVVEPLSGY